MESLALLPSFPWTWLLLSPWMCGSLSWHPLWLSHFCSLPVKCLAYSPAAALLQQDHNLRLIRCMFFASSNRFLPFLLFLETMQLHVGFLPSLPIQVDTLWQQRCCFSCQPHPGSTSCKLSISQGMRAFPRQECQRHSLFLSIVQQFFVRKKKCFSICCLLFFSFWNLVAFDNFV